MNNEIRITTEQFEEFLKQGIFDTVGDAISIQDTDFRILYQNKLHKDMIGDHIGKYCYNAYQGKESICDKCHIAMSFEDGLPHKFEQIRSTDKGVFHYEITGSPVKDSDGNIIAGIEVVRDITRRKLIEDALLRYQGELETRVEERSEQILKANEELRLREADRNRLLDEIRVRERRFSDIANNAQEWIWEVDEEGKYTYSSTTVEKILGYKNDEILGKYFYDLFHPDDREELKKSAFEVFKTKQSFREFINRNVRKDGKTVWLSTSGIPVIDAVGNLAGYRGADTDITDMKMAEQKLRKSKDMYKKLSQEFNTLLDAIPDNLILLSPDLKIVWLNKAAASMFDRDASELSGQYCFKLCCSIFVPCENCPALKSFHSGKEEEVQITTAQGKVWDIRAFPVMDRSGVKNVIEVARDITVRDRMEKEAKIVQTKLIQANKMTSLGTLVSGIVHEINNPNSFIMSNAQVINKVWRDNAKILAKHYRDTGDFLLGGVSYSKIYRAVPKLIRGISDGSVRIKKIIDNLKNFIQPEDIALTEEVDIKKVICMSRTILNHQIKKYTDNFHMTNKKNIPFVKGNAHLIEQVVINLIMNSLQSLPKKKCGVWVSSSFDKRSGHVIIKVKDEGIGIPNNIMDRITEPFFTTRLDRGGTGLGLSISYSIIKEHGGLLEFESEPGKGTTSTIKLPVYDK